MYRTEYVPSITSIRRRVLFTCHSAALWATGDDAYTKSFSRTWNQDETNAHCHNNSRRQSPMVSHSQQRNGAFRNSLERRIKRVDALIGVEKTCTAKGLPLAVVSLRKESLPCLRRFEHGSYKRSLRYAAAQHR